jgi:hypothetical protein
MSWIEGLGYAASVLVALSLTMSSIVRLRWVNLVGAGLFSAYGFLIAAMPVGLLNGYIVLANLYHLFGIYRRSEYFHLVDAKPDDPLVRYWLEKNRSDLEGFFPGVDIGQLEHPICSLMLRDNNPVGLLVGTQDGRSFEVALDYVFPAYRDFRTGQFLYRESGYFSRRGVTRVVTRSHTPRHQVYLERMGFEPVPDTHGEFEYLVKS